MPKSRSIQLVLAQAKEKEKRYNWLSAVEFHKRALGQVLEQKDFLKAGEIEERIGCCFHRAAMQAESREEFKERMRLAIEEYEKADEIYEKLIDEQKTGRVFRCKAVTKFFGYWLTSDPPEKRRLLNECWRLTKEALKAFEEGGDSLEYGRTFNILSSAAVHSFYLEGRFQVRETIIREAMEYGERTITLLSTVGDSQRSRLARAYTKTAVYLGIFSAHFIPDMNEKERRFQISRDYWQKANELSEEVALLELINTPGGLEFLLSVDEILVQCEKAFGFAKTTQDKYLMGTALDLLAFASYWHTVTHEIEDPDKRVESIQRALKYAEDAKRQFSSIYFVSPRGGVLWTGGPYSDYYFTLAMWETDLKKKRDLLKKAIVDGTREVKLARSSGYPEIVDYTHAILSGCLLDFSAHVETSLEKRRILEKALEHRKESIRITEELWRFSYWDRGVAWTHLADLKAELGSLELDLTEKRRIFEEATSNKERGLGLIEKVMPYYEKMDRLECFSVLYRYQDSYGSILNQLYALTKNPEYSRKAIKILEKAVESSNKMDLISHTAESHWKIARAQDILEEHLEAAENFEHASKSYMKAAGKIPQLEDFYQDHASYMQAWNEIEKAKNYHAKKQYGQAKEHYEKAANLHKSTERWNYLSSNYLAWARLEQAEDLSRREQTEEARDLFQKAAELFDKVKKFIGAKLEEIEVRDEKEMVDELAKASEIRREYCLGRIALEEAKILDRIGDHLESSKKYGLGARIFEKMAKGESERSRKELLPIIYLCRAWQKMMIAEAKTSSTSYGEAAELFKQAREHILDQPTSLLALANSSFCKALEAGTEFEITGDKANYSATKNHMQAAEKYYLKAGFETASEYAKATYILFDAYMYITKAETETNPGKKAQYYKMAEKLLQASAGSYMKAKHPEKSEEVQRLLANIKEKRQLAVSLTEVLHAPTITATTSSFSTPTPTHEKAVGLERFEHADIQANLTASKEVTVEEQMEIKLDLVNVSKESGLLIRVDELVPPSLKVAIEPLQYSIENGSINMKGRRLEPLKVESVKFSLQTTKAGVIELRPRIIYVDEVGNFKKCMPEPATITVHPKLTVEFKTEATHKVFDYLVRSFVEDYIRRRLIVQEAGWRSFVQIIRNAKVSSRSVYGSRGHHGPAISELERRGLIETRIFLGERGRGGKIAKTRISYEKEPVKRLVDQKVAKNE